MLKTSYEEIVDVQAIGQTQNTRNLNDLLPFASAENLSPAENDPEQNLLVIIDMQNDFMENGSLGVPGSHGDVERLTRFMYKNMAKISQIAMTLDTHIPHQIFFPCWWVDQDGNNPPPFTPITKEDLVNGKWRPVYFPADSVDYVEGLKKAGNMDLFIWTYHCIQGTFGCTLENQLSNMIYFHAVAKKSTPICIVKGTDPLSEMYGIIKPEYDKRNYVNLDFLNLFEKYHKIIIAGEAASHCVLRSIQQFLEYYSNRPDILRKFVILEDCMSDIPGFDSKSEYGKLKKENQISIVKSVDLVL
jgi:nicotinamidase-related amidase